IDLGFGPAAREQSISLKRKPKNYDYDFYCPRSHPLLEHRRLQCPVYLCPNPQRVVGSSGRNRSSAATLRFDEMGADERQLQPSANPLPAHSTGQGTTP